MTVFTGINDGPLQLGRVRYSPRRDLSLSLADVVGGPCKGSCDDGAEFSFICRSPVPFSTNNRLSIMTLRIIMYSYPARTPRKPGGIRNSQMSRASIGRSRALDIFIYFLLVTF